MCEYCKSCFAEPNSDESMPILIGDDTVRTEKGHPLARISTLMGYSNNSKCLNEKKSHIEFSLHTATDGEDLAQVDIPIKYCPFCGATLHIKKKAPAKALIEKHSRDFRGTLTDGEVIKLTGLSRNTYYKYK